MEEQLVTLAQQAGAPRIAPEVAARLLGADQAQLEAQLQAAAHSADAAQAQTGSGLRLDQAAAAFLAVTSDRRAEILVGPAGSGKTRTAAEAARAWREAGMGEVYGLTTSQAARNVLRDAGVDLAVQHRGVPRPPARAAGSPRHQAGRGRARCCCWTRRR